MRTINTGVNWWTWPGSNRRPPACKAGALPAELHAHSCNHRSLNHFCGQRILIPFSLCSYCVGTTFRSHLVGQNKFRVFRCDCCAIAGKTQPACVFADDRRPRENSCADSNQDASNRSACFLSRCLCEGAPKRARQTFYVGGRRTTPQPFASR